MLKRVKTSSTSHQRLAGDNDKDTTRTRANVKTTFQVSQFRPLTLNFLEVPQPHYQ